MEAPISVKGLRKAYQGVPAVRDISFSVNPGEIFGLLGENGAGKSTFIKLLTRLYNPTEGEILLNGINIKEYDYDKYQRMFAPVFQNFAKYYFSLGEHRLG